MKTTILLKGQEYDSASMITEKYGITYMTLYKWTKDGLLPHPIKLGRRNYYNREAIEIIFWGSIRKEIAVLG